MKLRNKSKRDYEDDGLLPLVNIIFLLLIFFMIAHQLLLKSAIKGRCQFWLAAPCFTLAPWRRG